VEGYGRDNGNNAISIGNGLSDHDAQCLVLKNIKFQVKRKVQVITRSLVNENSIAQFINKLSNNEWEIIYNLNDVNEILNTFLNRFLLVYEACFPVQNLTNNHNDNGWITTGIRASCRRKISLFILCGNNCNYLFKSYYKSYCMILKKVIREAKRIYCNQLITSAENKIKTTWNIINTESGRFNNLNKERLPLIFQNNSKKINIKEAAHSFNKYFTSVTENHN
jgi:hypothetical protein